MPDPTTPDPEIVSAALDLTKIGKLIEQWNQSVKESNNRAAEATAAEDRARRSKADADLAWGRANEALAEVKRREDALVDDRSRQQSAASVESSRLTTERVALEQRAAKLKEAEVAQTVARAGLDEREQQLGRRAAVLDTQLASVHTAADAAIRALQAVKVAGA